MDATHVHPAEDTSCLVIPGMRLSTEVNTVIPSQSDTTRTMQAFLHAAPLVVAISGRRGQDGTRSTLPGQWLILALSMRSRLWK